MNGRWTPAAIVATILGGSLLYWLWSGPEHPIVEADYHPEFVRDLEVLANGAPVPADVHATDALALRIRFRTADQSPASPPPAAYLLVVSPNGYGRTMTDVIVATRQEPTTGKSPPVLTIREGVKVVDVTPDPPGPGDQFWQYCAMLAPRTLKKNRHSDDLLELQLWLYPIDPSSDTGVGTGTWVYRHKFHLFGVSTD